MDFTPLNVTLAIFGISFLVIVHEAGHYLAARAFGMRVLRFSIGLGPALWKHKPKDSPTTFQVCALPLLAYVQIDGMNPTDDVDPKDPTLYPNKGVFARIVVIFAGPLANYLAAALIAFGLHLVGGWPYAVVTNRVDMTFKHSAAERAGMRAGDEIVDVNGHAVADRDELVAATTARAGQATPYVVVRDGERMAVTVTPEANEEGQVLLGVRLVAVRAYRTTAVSEAAMAALREPADATVRTLAGIAYLIEQRTTENVVSGVGMTKMLADTLRIAPQLYFWLIFQLSVALGLFNLLPFPALDGGRLAFLGYEVITRRRANERVETAVHTVGLVFLLGVVAYFMVRDVVNL
jgi:regulator of sigma E protease